MRISMAGLLFLGLWLQSPGLAAEEGTKEAEMQKARVTGIGGVFFLANDDHVALFKWYEEHLGIKKESWGGGLLMWEQDERKDDGGSTVWHVAAKDSDWFKPSDQRFMINYRVDDLERLLEQLKAADIAIHKGPEYHENGIFAQLFDPEGNLIELWQPMAWDDKNKREVQP